MKIWTNAEISGGLRTTEGDPCELTFSDRDGVDLDGEVNSRVFGFVSITTGYLFYKMQYLFLCFVLFLVL